MLTLIDLENSPDPDRGYKIEILHGSDGYVKFTVVGLDGTVMTDYFMFMPSQGRMEWRRFVSAMGFTYFYTFDTSARELLKIENDSREDVSETLKEMGRFDTAAETTSAEAVKMENYFRTQFGVSISEAFNDASFGA